MCGIPAAVMKAKCDGLLQELRDTATSITVFSRVAGPQKIRREYLSMRDAMARGEVFYVLV